MPACATCPSACPTREPAGEPEFTVALAGNPNTGKSTVFNGLTGLRQHVGNWPGKTVARVEGLFTVAGRRCQLVDLPGTYSLLAASTDETIARDFLLFGRPDVTIVVLDATALERNLNLALQVLAVTDRVVVCLNLLDEAQRQGLRVSPTALAEALGAPVVATVANRGQGLAELAAAVLAVATGEIRPDPPRITGEGPLWRAVGEVAEALRQAAPELPHRDWVALRLLEADPAVTAALTNGSLPGLPATWTAAEAEAIARVVEAHRGEVGAGHHDELVATLYARAEAIAAACLDDSAAAPPAVDRLVDRILCHRVWGFAVMTVLLGLVFWLTIAGANVPSAALADLFFAAEAHLARWFDALGAPWWLTGALVHGIWRGLGWVVSVMLPPMAIFFPCFTLLEDLGYLPRVAFNLDRLFRAAGAHGKQALTMSMGFGCNAAGVTACRIIESPRERLIAILTNNFVPCNGRFPTLIMLALVFVAPVFGPRGSLAAALTLLAVVVLGVLTTLAVSWLLSRTLLRGEPSAFVLELPPYRRPRLGQVLYTSFIDRTLFVLWRAVIFAAPAGLIIWLLGNWELGGVTAYARLAGWLDPFGRALGLDGVILLAYIVAIPANEIVVPTIFMGYNVLAAGGQRMLVELDSLPEITRVLIEQQGWTLLTAVCLTLFCLLHNPCSTATLTIWKETGRARWAAVGFFLPLTLAVLVCFVVAQVGRLFI